MSDKPSKSKTTHWYDGLFYNMLITPFETEIIKRMIELIPAGSSVIDLGCGPGTLAMKLSQKCGAVTGVDISNRMIRFANRQKKNNRAANLTFICDDASTMAPIQKEKFSFAILSMCLHGMSAEIREAVIKNCFNLAEQVIITDFISPWPKNIRGAGQIILEKIEGEESFRNFNDWLLIGGIDGFIEGMRLKVIKERPWSDGFGKTILVIDK